MPKSGADRKARTDARKRAAKARADRADRERIAKIVRGEADASGAASERPNGWLRAVRWPQHYPAAVKPYWRRVKGDAPAGVGRDDLPLLMLLARSLYLADYHGRYASEPDRADWRHHAAARDRSIDRAMRLHERLSDSAERNGPDVPEAPGGNVVVGKFDS